MQVHDADIKLLRVFDAIVRCGGYAAAQSSLNLSASRISEYMSQLETRVGIRLCDRGRGGFRLTADGTQLHQAALRLLGAVDTFRLESGALSKQLRGTLLFGVIEATLTDQDCPLLPAIRNFTQIAPDVHLKIVMDHTAGMQQKVLDGSLHVALGPFPNRVAGLNYKTLYREEQFLYCAAPHPVFSCPPGSEQIAAIRSSKLAARSYVGGKEVSMLKISDTAASVDNVEGRAMLILSGNYLGFLPPHYARSWEQSGILKRILPDRFRTHLEFKMIWRRGPQAPRAVQLFREHLAAAGQIQQKQPHQADKPSHAW